MNLINDTLIRIRCEINGFEPFFLDPKENKFFAFNEKTVLLRVSHIYESCQKSCFDLNNVYHIVINSELTMGELTSNTNIVITGEIVHFELGYVYDRFFVWISDALLLNEKLIISNLTELCQKATETKKADSFGERIATFLLSGGFWLSTGLFLLFKFGFGANEWEFSWWLILLFWILGYGLQVLGEKIFYNLNLKEQPRVRELKQFCSTEYVLRYYNNSTREWIANDRQDL